MRRRFFWSFLFLSLARIKQRLPPSFEKKSTHHRDFLRHSILEQSRVSEYVTLWFALTPSLQIRAARYSEFRCKSCYQRGSPQGLGSKSEEAMMTPTEVVSDAILFVYPLRHALAKSPRVCHTKPHNLC